MRVFLAPVSLTIIMTMFLSACSHWPSQDHRAVDLNAIEKIVQNHCQPDAALRDSMNGLGVLMSAQTTDIQTLTNSVEALKVTPAVPTTVPVATKAKVRACPPVSSPKKSLNDNKIVIGATEWIKLLPPGRYLKARIDTGAATSSISAKNIVRFERDGDRWVSFDLDTDDEGDPIHLELPLVRNVKIRQASFDDIDRRPVVRFDVMLGDELRQPTTFSLADRSRMSYPVLLGRSFLKDMAVVDVSVNFLHPRIEGTKK